MNTRNKKWGLRFAIAGLLIGVGLYAYGSYLTSPSRTGDLALVLILRHPSFGADRAAAIER
jgi:hypothetical protein